MVRKTTTKRATRASGEDDGEERKSTRDIWKGSITFGLVEIPIALVSAEKPSGISLSYLDKRDFSPVGYRRYNKSNDKEVPWSEIVHGYQYAKGEYVVVGKNDLARANPALTQTISIEQFVDGAEIEPIFYEKPYYLEPLKKNSKAYALLRETLRRTKKVGIARVAIRTREHIAVVGVRGHALVLYLLRFAKEIRPAAALDNVGAKGPSVSPKEIEMAERLVEDMSGEWDPNQYEDQYENDLMKVIERKIKAGEVHALDDGPAPKPKAKRGEIFDLMPLLRKSVEAAQSRSSTSSTRKGPRSTSSSTKATKKRARPAARRRSA
jgi:DNA end-binding protein Ku